MITNDDEEVNMVINEMHSYMSYVQSVAFLREINGVVPHSYTNPNHCKKGFYTHHVKESVIPYLSLGKSEFKEFISYAIDTNHLSLGTEKELIFALYDEYQKAEYLVYCTKLEHKALHIKIRREYPEMRKFLKLYKAFKQHQDKQRLEKQEFLKTKIL